MTQIAPCLTKMRQLPREGGLFQYYPVEFHLDAEHKPLFRGVD